MAERPAEESESASTGLVDVAPTSSIQVDRIVGVDFSRQKPACQGADMSEPIAGRSDFEQVWPAG
jgi:hypothetical protein